MATYLMSLFHRNGGIHGELHSRPKLLANSFDVPGHFEILLLALGCQRLTVSNFTATGSVVSSDLERNTNTVLVVAASLAMY